MPIDTLLKDYDKTIESETSNKEDILELQKDVERHLDAVKLVIFDSDKVINDLQAAKQQLETESQNLDQRDKAAQMLTESYFENINTVRTALTGGGALVNQPDSSRDAITNNLAINVQQLTTLLDEITKYDQDTQKIVDDAQSDLDTAQSEYDTALQEFEKKSDILTKVEENLANLVDKARQAKDQAEEDAGSIANSIAAGNNFEAVFLYYDFKARMDALVNEVDLSKPHFDADNTDKALLTGALKTDWNTAKNEFSVALEDLHNKNMELIQHRSKLAKAKAEMQKRIVNRAQDAEKLVEGKHSEL